MSPEPPKQNLLLQNLYVRQGCPLPGNPPNSQPFVLVCDKTGDSTDTSLGCLCDKEKILAYYPKTVWPGERLRSVCVTGWDSLSAESTVCPVHDKTGYSTTTSSCYLRDELVSSISSGYVCDEEERHSQQSKDCLTWWETHLTFLRSVCVTG